MSTYVQPADLVPLVLVRSTHINNANAAAATAFALIPDETKIKRGTVSLGVDAGAADAYLVALTYAPSGYVDGLRATFLPLNTNTGASTVNVNSLGVKSIRNSAGSALVAGDMVVGCPVDIVYSTVTGFFHLSTNSAATATAAAASALAAASSASAASSSASSASSSASTSTANAAATAAALAGIYGYYNAGDIGALSRSNGAVQRWAPTGSKTLSIANWAAAGTLSELLLEGINLGAATISWATINWVKYDGATTTTFSSNGVTLQSSGTDWILLWTRDGGTTVYGKIMR